MTESEMADREMAWLRKDIEYHTNALYGLQEKHRRLTGQNHTPDLRLDPPKATIENCICGCGDFVIVSAKK
jgi:hypothetical protein